MPTYEYKCGACGHGFEIVQSMKDKTKRKCPECKRHKLKRIFGTPFVFVKGDPQTIGIGLKEIQKKWEDMNSGTNKACKKKQIKKLREKLKSLGMLKILLLALEK